MAYKDDRGLDYLNIYSETILSVSKVNKTEK